MSFYADMAGVTDRMVATYGAACTLTRTVPGSYNPETGATATGTATTYTGVCAVFGYSQRDRANTDIREGDRRVLIAPSGMTLPRTGDTLAIGGTTYTVVAARELSPAGVPVMFEAQVRGV